MNGHHRAIVDVAVSAISVAPRRINNQAELQSTLGVLYTSLGEAYYFLRREKEGMEALDAAIKADPDAAAPYGILGMVYNRLGRMTEAVRAYQMAMKRSPDWFEVIYNLANAYENIGQSNLAVPLLEKALRIKPESHLAYHALANAFFHMGELKRSEAASRKAIMIYKDEAYYHTLSGTLASYRSPVAYRSSLEVLEECLSHFPDSIETLIRLANIHVSLDTGRYARPYLRRALELDPTNHRALGDLANSLRNDRYFNKAVPLYRLSYEHSGAQHSYAYCNYVYALQFVLDWSNRTESFTHLLEILNEEAQKPPRATSHLCVHPFMTISYPLPIQVLKVVAKRHASIIEEVAREKPLPRFTFENNFKRVALGKGGEKGVLRIGYIGFEFGDLIVGRDMRRVWITHDREKVEVYLYALNPDDGTEWRQQAMSDADVFRDLSRVPNHEAAKMIHSDGIDILINLTGYTRGERTDIHAYRPAPVQVFFKGYMGTSGASFIDYTLTDMHTAPPQYQRHYTEKFAYMNDTFFVSDYPFTHSYMLKPDRYQPKRSDFGLPETGIIFSCFNQLYKIDPEIFATWMRILKRVPDSVLWLIFKPREGRPNILREAEAAGVDPNRIIFLGPQHHFQHIPIKGMADLFLDTPLYNAHATGTDALWGGVPIITIPRVSMASRVASSFMHTIGLSELVVGTLQEYEDLAVALAEDPERLAAIKRKVADARTNSTLFDIKSWTVRAEAVYQSMFETRIQTRHLKKPWHVF